MTMGNEKFDGVVVNKDKDRVTIVINHKAFYLRRGEGNTLEIMKNWDKNPVEVLRTDNDRLISVG